jgi:hypothetical protein
MKGMGVVADLGTKGDWEQSTGVGLNVSEVRSEAVEGSDEVGVDLAEVVDGRDKGEEVMTYEFLLGTPEAILALINERVLVWM